jgi:hypothetical protein
MLLLLGVAT